MIRLLCWLAALVFTVAAQAQTQGSPAPREHRLGAGDAVRVTVFQQPEFALETQVADDGTIVYPLVGPIVIAGLTPSAAGRLLADRLRDGKYLQRPFVNVVVTQHRSVQIALLGNVQRPGRYPLEQAQTRLSEALALAGGITPAGADVVWVLSRVNGREERVDVDLQALAGAAEGALDPMLRDGDVIYVPRAPVFYIYGEVQRPGQYRLERDMTVLQALAVGGGLNQRGTERGLRLSRREGGQLATRSAAPSDPVRADDIIFVRESIF